MYKCDFCEKILKEGNVIFDSMTKLGPWAWMCSKCYSINGVNRLGTGFGQKYKIVKGKLKRLAGSRWR